MKRQNFLYAVNELDKIGISIKLTTNLLIRKV